MRDKKKAGLAVAFVVTTSLAVGCKKSYRPYHPPTSTSTTPTSTAPTDTEPPPPTIPEPPATSTTPPPNPPPPEVLAEPKPYLDIVIRPDGTCVQIERSSPRPCPPGASCMEPDLKQVICPDVTGNERTSKRADGQCEFYLPQASTCPKPNPGGPIPPCNPPAPQRVILPCSDNFK